MLASAPPASNRATAILYTAYAVVGGGLLAYFFGLSMWALIALWIYVIGLVWLMVLAKKQAMSKQMNQTVQKTPMQREYLVTEAGLEIRMPDLTQTISAAGIVRLETRERGTLVHLSKSTPMFLPFGTEFRSDFIDALRAKIEHRG